MSPDGPHASRCPLPSWLNVLSGGVEELRFTTGDSPVEAGPTLAPRLPGVIAATRWGLGQAGSTGARASWPWAGWKEQGW